MTEAAPTSFFECPVCEWSLVMPTENDPIYCPNCFSDCLHMNKMTARPSKPEDKPEGVDIRLIYPGKFE